MIRRLGPLPSPRGYTNHQTTSYKTKKLLSVPRQAEKFLGDILQNKTCRSCQSTEEQALSQQPDTHLLDINCKQQKYTINLLSQQSLSNFCEAIDHSYKMRQITKISIKMMVIKRALEMNEKMVDRWSSVLHEYESFHQNIFNC